jgi:hypothetical protein
MSNDYEINKARCKSLREEITKALEAQGSTVEQAGLKGFGKIKMLEFILAGLTAKV